MRLFILTVAAGMMATPAFAQTKSAPAATSAAATSIYTSSNTPIGTLLDDPAAKAIVEKHIPGMTTNDQIEMARGMTLKAVQQYSPDEVTDARLAAIDAEFAKLKQK